MVENAKNRRQIATNAGPKPLRPVRNAACATGVPTTPVLDVYKRQILLIVDVAMAHIEGMASLDQDAVICQHRELQYLSLIHI